MNPVSTYLSVNKPGIIIGLGIGSMLVSTALAFKYAPLAKDAIERRKQDLNTDQLEPAEVIRTAGPYFLPSTLFAITGVICIVSGNQMNVNRGAAAMAAYALSESSLRNYREQTREIVGEKKEKDIQEATTKSGIKNEQPANGEIYITGKGDTLCYDKISGRYFKSNIEKLKKVRNELNYEMLDTTFISLNKYYMEINLPPVTLGDELGWDVGRGLIDMRFSSDITSDGDPYIIVDFDVSPKHF